MESVSNGWWSRHGWTVVLLLTAFGISFAIRSIWTYPVVSQWGALYTFAGGSDSYYHLRVSTYIIQTHTNLVFDPLLNFPNGGYNPREPLFDWMNAILGVVFAPFFGGNAVDAGAWFLSLQAPLWSALGVFPVYLIGREVSDKRTGLIAAFIFPFLSANIDSSIFGYANYLSFYTFLVLVLVYSYIRTVKTVGNRRWVEDYRHPRQYLPALRAFFRTERTAVKWAVFTGVSLGALALAWQGYTYGVVVIAVSLVVAMVVERVRRVDSFGLYVATAIVGLVGFPMAMPYYLVQHQFATWFDLPMLVFFGALALLLPFLLMRDVPWVFSIPFLVALVGAGVGVLAVVSPTDFTNLVTGQGYFVKTLIYSTVAEAQAPSIDQLVIGYGVVTFFLAFVGLAIFLYLLVRGRFKRHHIVFLVFAILSIYLPISAAKFFLIGSPIFALLPAEAIRRVLDIGKYNELRRTTASLADRRSQFSAFRKAFKPRHVLVMALVLIIILPNIWMAIDAGIPGNTKQQYAAQVGATLPPWLQLNSSNPGSYYFGAAGTSLDTPDEYDSAGYNWLAQQDVNVPAPQRPAFVSWWDYGFQAIAQGGHPSVADNFQHGIDPAGQFLLSQNESQAIAVLATTLLQGEQRASGQPYLPSALNRVLAADGLNLATLHTLMVNTSADYAMVVAHPERYLPVNPSTLTLDNAMYMAMTYFLATSLSRNGVAKVYDDIQAYTGWSIRYAMTDSRLFPFSGSDTGIFYAPADLTGRVIGTAGEPVTYFNLTVLGSDGSYYPYGSTLPSGVTQVGSPLINYLAPFYNSMIYRIYIGYNGTDVGQSPGIPGLSLNATIEPGWMLQHFQVVYKTAYLCSQPNYGGSCDAMNLPEAIAQAPKVNGSADTRPYSYFSGGESILEYYPGQTLVGNVQLPDGAPVGGARVTVYDGWSIPHETVLTEPDGSFSLVLPPGNDTVNITIGPLEPSSQAGGLLLKSVKIVVPDAVGLSLNAPNLAETFTVGSGSIQGFVYWNNQNSTSYTPPEDTLVPGAQVVFWGSNLTRHFATTDASGSFDILNVAPGRYNYSILYGGHNFTESVVTVTPGTSPNATAGLTPALVVGKVSDPSGALVSGATVALSNASGTLSTDTTNTTGRYQLGSVGPGNYTVLASVAGTDLRSPGVPVTIAPGKSNESVNLTLQPVGSTTFVLTANGAAAAGIPVRFTPIVPYANASVSPLVPLASASRNATVVVSSASGSVTATLPVGNYSVYANGWVSDLRYAGLATASVVAGASASPAALPLSPVVSLTGSVAPVGPESSTETAVIAYAASGSEVVTWATSGAFSLSLPAGTYSLLALEGPPGSPSSLSAALTRVSLSSDTRVALSPVSALRAEFSVGAALPSGGLFPAAGANVTVSAGTNGPSVPATADGNGSVVFYVPASLPLSAGEYCVRTTAWGFASTSTCNLSPSGLAALTVVPTTLNAVSVTLTVQGLPSGTPVTVNFTAESATAVNLSVTGGPTFAFSLPPGLYGVGARAVIGSGSVVYLPTSVLATTIPVGATRSALTLIVIPQVNATGVLSLPSGLSAANVAVSLSSSVLNLSVNGSAFVSGFRAAPGTYSAYATGKVGGTTYASLSRVTVAATGAVSPSIVLTSAGPLLSGTLVGSSGATVPLNTTVRLVTPGGAAAVATAVNGTFSLPLNPSMTYSVFVNGTLVASGPNGSYFRSWTAAPGALCSVGAANSSCSVPLVGTAVPVWLNGSLVVSGTPGTAAGTVRLVGPYPSTNATVVTSANGSFSLPLLPGAYSLYAQGSGSAQGRAALASVLALPSTTLVPVTVTLSPTWVDTISLVPPSGTTGALGAATVTVTNALGTQAIYTNASWSSAIALALPLGTYTVSAVANGTFGGAPATASASATVTILNGNVGTVLSLAYVPRAAVSGVLVGPTSATVAAGGSTTFSFAVRNTGNVPVTVSPVGTPSYWTFNFSFANVTLQPGPSGSSYSGEVRITVPGGTPVAHPTVTLEFEAANGTVLGSVEPGPSVNVIGYFGIALGPSSLPVRVGPSSAIVPFYVHNTGNVEETVLVAIADTVRLEGLGWSSNLTSGATPQQVERELAAGDNVTIDVNLTATSSIFVPPGSVTVAATVVDASGSAFASATLTVPLGVLEPSTTSGLPPVVVTGPAVGSAPSLLPVWVVPVLSFVPAIALLVGVFTYRWWRRRRWTRR